MKINGFPMRYEIWKGRKIVRQKAGSNSIALKSTRLTIYATETDVKQVCFFIVDCPNHTLVGGVTVSSLCQQGGVLWLRLKKCLFALSVNNLVLCWRRFGANNSIQNRADIEYFSPWPCHTPQRCSLLKEVWLLHAWFLCCPSLHVQLFVSKEEKVICRQCWGVTM